jgi:hypothetical protein
MNPNSTQNIGTLRRSYDLPRGYVVEFSLDTAAGAVVALRAEWSPFVPNREAMRALLPAYREARNDFQSEIARAIGGAVAVIEVPE